VGDLPQKSNFLEDTTMKNFGIACVALLVVASLVGSASAADSISKSTLSSMGLGSMQLMSDSDGLAVRGMGTSASVWGEGIANYPGGQASLNGYDASASHRHGGSSAQGKNFSFAGSVKVNYSSNRGLSVRASLGVAGGSSSASAH
jgi:hypothetical protein